MINRGMVNRIRINKASLMTGAALDAPIIDRMRLSMGLSGGAHMGADVFVSHLLSASLTGGAKGSLDIYSADDLYMSLVGYASVYSIAENTVFLDLNLPPGSTLVIDAENYTVTLDNEDAIWAHRGAWLWLDRTTINLTLSAIGGTYSWEVFYVGEYL